MKRIREGLKMQESIEKITEKSLPKEKKRRSFLTDLFFRLLKEKPLGTLGLVIIVILVLTAIFADLGWLGLPNVRLAPYAYGEISLTERLQGPSSTHPLGTDNLGGDILSRIIYGSRVSMAVGLGASLIGVAIAVTIGIFSGFFGGWIDIVAQRFVDAFMCFPGLVLILTIMSIMGTGMIQVIVVLGVMQGITSSRVVRSSVLSIKENIYVQAGTAIGSRNGSILSRHILPNIMAPIIILFTINIGAAIISEATISFLGLGIPPPTPSWGGMLQGSGRTYMLQAPWMALWPGVALAVVVYGINMLGDALRDLYDPRLRGGLGRYGRGNIKVAKKTSKAA
jgi:peptide/nickel transport system permease protein